MNCARKISAVFLLMGLGCGEYDPKLAVSGGEPIVSYEEFAASVYREPWEGGAYIVDGDIALTGEDELRAYYEEWVPAEDALTVNRIFNTDDVWSYPQRFHLTYCVSDLFGSDKANVVSTLARATASWHDQIGVRFEYIPSEDATCTASNNDVTFDVRPANATYFARAFFPSYGRSSRNLFITDSAMTTNSGGRDFEGILRHELGHAIGFRHEHIWLRDPCTTETTDDARAVTSYDVNSVMHYPQCRPSDGGGYRQTATDYSGSRSLYGLAPAQIRASLSSL